MHLLAALLGCGKRIFALFQMAEDVFQHDHRIIDQSREHQRQTAQSHGVDGAAESVNQQERRHAGDGNREQHGNGSPDGAEEDQDHQRGQAQTHTAFVQHVGDSGLDILGLIKDDRSDQVLRNVDQLFYVLPDPIDDLNGIAVSALSQDWQIHRLLPVHAHDVVLQRRGIFRLADVAEAQHVVANRLQRNVVPVLGIRQFTVAVNVVIQRADAYISGRQN